MLQDSKFFVDETMRAMHADALLSSHPLIAARSSPEEIKEAFDVITYGKVTVHATHWPNQ